MTVPRPIWADRFWSKVDVNGPVPKHRPELGRCHIWTSTLNQWGYGRFVIEHHEYRPHRLVLELAGISIPDKWQADHLCRNTSCLRLSHLEVVTNRENFLRSTHAKAISYMTDTCVSGRHQFTEENTRKFINRSGLVGRRCRACSREATRRRYRARTAAK